MPIGLSSLKNSAAKESARIETGSIVEYEHNNKPLLGVVLEEKNGKWVILSQHGREIELPATRLYLFPGKLPSGVSDRAEFLQKLEKKADALARDVRLDEVWEIVRNEVSEVSITDITELCFPEDSLEHRLATKRALLADKLYFKRKKTTYEPRTDEIVAELKLKLEAQETKERQREELATRIIARLNGDPAALPAEVRLLEDLAVFGRDAEQPKEAEELLRDIIERSKRTFSGDIQDQAFHLLVAAGHFRAGENLAPKRYRRSAEFPRAVSEAAVSVSNLRAGKDLTGLVTFTIDSPKTQDVDDALSIEKLGDGYRLGIHIADVASYVENESPINDEALQRGTSIYCPDINIPMIPRSLSEDLFSLHQGKERLTVSFFVVFNGDHKIISREIIPSRIRVTNRLSYDEVDALLHSPAADDVSQALHQLSELATRLEETRLENGAFQFSRRQLIPVLDSDGKVHLEDQGEDSPAHKLVGEMMILANETAGLFARDKNFALIFRTQEPPEVDFLGQGLEIEDGIAREYYRRSFLKRSVNTVQPLSHFGLALSAYAQVTSPIRRAVDLINERQLLHFLSTGDAYYHTRQMQDLITNIDVSLQEAQSVQRESERFFVLRYLEQEKLQDIWGTVIKTDLAKPLAELDIVYMLQTFLPPGFRNDRRIKTNKRPGDRVHLKIENLNPRRDILVLSEIP